MTIKEAADKMRALIKKKKRGATFEELQIEVGVKGFGPHDMGEKELNILWWVGMSRLFLDAYKLLLPEIEPTVVRPQTYGTKLNYPVATEMDRRYRDIHWLPVVWKMAGSAPDVDCKPRTKPVKDNQER
jgi:hypothetical protein